MRTLFRCLALLTLVALQACPEPCCAPPPPPPPPPPAVPNPPSGLVATPMSSSQINLGWADGSNNEDGFAIERCIGVACSNFAAWHTAPVDATAYIDITVVGGTSYSYRVRATNSMGLSGFSNVATAVTMSAGAIPAPPTNPAATATSSSSITVTWTDASTNEDGFKIERCQGSGCTNFNVYATTLTPNGNSTVVSGLSASTLYRFRIQSYNGTGGSAYAGPVEATTLPAATVPQPPTGLVATAVSSSQINLSWTDASTNEDGFTIERCAGVACSTFTGIGGAGANSTAFNNTNLTPATSYTYRVKAYNGAGSSAYSALASAQTPAGVVVPAPPTNPAAVAANSSQIDVSWTDASINEDGFKLERCQGVGCTNFAWVGTTLSNATLFQNNGLIAGTTYRYRIQSFNTAGASAFTAVVTATTPAALIAPVLAAPVVSGTSVTLTWTYTWTGLGCSCDGYQLEESTTSATTGFAVVASPAGRTSPSSVTLNGRAAGTHYYRVRAVTGSGGTPYSTVVTAVIAAQTQRISLTNNLSSTGGNQVLRFRVAASTTSLYSAANTSAERLSPDNFCGTLAGEAVDPGETQVFDVSANAPNYYVYIGLGKWDNTDLNGNQTCWQKKNWGFDGTNLLYMFTAIQWNGHTAGTNQWTITYNAQNQIVLRTSSGDLPFVVSTNSDPIH